MYTRRLLAALALPLILACAGLPGGGGGTSTETPAAPAGPDAVTELDAAVSELDAAVAEVEAADPATLVGPRLGDLRERLRGAVDSLRFAVEKSVSKPAAPAAPGSPAAPAAPASPASPAAPASQ